MKAQFFRLINLDFYTPDLLQVEFALRTHVCAFSFHANRLTGDGGQALGSRWRRPRILTSVRLHVLVEVLLHVEVLAAPLAHELLVADVDAHVGAQLVLVLEALIAVLRVGGR